MTTTAATSANTVQVDAGKTVGDVRREQAEVLNIPDGAQVRLNGQPVDDDYVLRDGDSIEFIMPAGEKGIAAS